MFSRFSDLCAGINQRDVLERNQQVSLMKKIYSEAERVIGWLGSDENGGSQALKTFETLFKNAISYPNKFEWAQRMPELFTLDEKFSTKDGKTYESNHRLEKLYSLLKRPFWNRIWILQELVLPQSLRLMCGEEYMEFPERNAFYITVNRLARMPVARPASLPLYLSHRLNECMAALRLVARLRFQQVDQISQGNIPIEGASKFITTRVLLEFHQASDLRDHVYGLLGLIDLEIAPDYREEVTAAEVFLQVARCCLKTQPLGVLSLAGSQLSCSGRGHLTPLDSPSWVPDWRFPNPARIRLRRYPQSHAFPSEDGLQMQVIDNKWLRGPGIVWDTVASTKSKTGWDLEEWDLADDIDIGNTDNMSYPSGIPIFSAFVLLWLGGYDGSRSPERDLQLDSELFRSYLYIFFANILKPWVKKLSQRGGTLGRTNTAFAPLKQAPSVPHDHRESYVHRSRQLRYDMRYFQTEKGYIGFGPLATEVGDVVCVLEGHKAPVLLRRQSSHYCFIGDCDVVGIMNREVLEAVKRGEAEISDIEIR